MPNIMKFAISFVLLYMQGPSFAVSKLPPDVPVTVKGAYVFELRVADRPTACSENPYIVWCVALTRI
jgi:hypothetical protein